MSDTNDTDRSFDCAMRELHRHSLERLSAPTRSRLRLARQSAMTTPPRGLRAWPLGGAVAAVLVVGVALRLQPAPAPPMAGSGEVAPPPVSIAAATPPDAAIALDETPDLYLWLAAGDALALSSEQAHR